MSQKVAELLAELTPDPWRTSTPYTDEMADANRRIFEAGVHSETIRGYLSSWLQKYQPCLFGRLAARQDLLSYCILTEVDLQREDAAIHNKIQDARLQWLQDGFAGKKSGFVILAVSPRIVNATPDQNLRALAQRLCSLYLQDEIAMDTSYLDEIWLEKPGPQRMTWRWSVGANYFCANGDGRWWHDHRIPGGLAFSMNSVGHLVKSGAITRAMNALDQILGVTPESGASTPVDSLNSALEFAMRTIALASNAVSGKATELMPRPDSDLPSPKCPVKLPPFLAGLEHSHYRGYYHTDFTLPSEFFIADIRRPYGCKGRTLDLSYLFDDGLENPDYLTMGAGRRVRGESQRSKRFEPTTQPLEACSRLLQALNHK